jgi:hypothetical protein
MKYTPEEIRKTELKLKEEACLQGECATSFHLIVAADMLKAMLKAVETLHDFYQVESYNDAEATAALTPFDFTKEDKKP